MIGKGMLGMIVTLALFAGLGMMHFAQMVGILKVDIAITPTAADSYEFAPQTAKGKR